MRNLLSEGAAAYLQAEARAAATLMQAIGTGIHQASQIPGALGTADGKLVAAHEFSGRFAQE